MDLETRRRIAEAREPGPGEADELDRISLETETQALIQGCHDLRNLAARIERDCGTNPLTVDTRALLIEVVRALSLDVFPTYDPQREERQGSDIPDTEF